MELKKKNKELLLPPWERFHPKVPEKQQKKKGFKKCYPENYGVVTLPSKNIDQDNSLHVNC